MIDQLRNMAVFHSVVETGSFRSAAKTLHLSPSVVSHHVSQLETALGTALLYRSTRRMSLTSDGERVYEASKKMLEAAQSGIEPVVGRSDEPTGTLKVAVTGAVFESTPFADYLADFAKTYPGIKFSVSFSDQKIDLIGSVYDAAIRVGWLKDSRYKARKLCDLERSFVASPDYMKDRPLPKSVDDLEDHDWIKLAQLAINKQLMNNAGLNPNIQPKISIEVDSAASLCKMAILGMGIASVPRFLVADDIDEGRLIELHLDWDLAAAGAYIVWPNNTSADSLTNRFVDFMVTRHKSEKLHNSARNG